jgi:hypothetical protein
MWALVCAHFIGVKCYYKSLLIDVRLDDMVSGLMTASVQQGGKKRAAANCNGIVWKLETDSKDAQCAVFDW